MMLIAVLELSFHAKYHRREKFLGAPGGTILGLMVCGLMLTLAPCTTKTSAGEKKRINHSWILENIYIQDVKYLHCVC